MARETGMEVIAEYQHIALEVLTFFLVLGVSVYVMRKVKKGNGIPKNLITLFFLGIIDFWKGICKDLMGAHGLKYVPWVTSVFIFILFMNLMGLIPGFIPATMNINTNLGIAIFVFLTYNFFGFREHGIKYTKHFLGPLLPIAILYLPVEVISHLFRMISLSVRLAGNMFGDHSVLEIFSHLVPLFVPVAFLILGFIVCLIQAFIFAVLFAIYIALAVSHD